MLTLFYKIVINIMMVRGTADAESKGLSLIKGSLFHYFHTHSAVEVCRDLAGKMKLNDPGRQAQHAKLAGQNYSFACCACLKGFCLPGSFIFILPQPNFCKPLRWTMCGSCELNLCLSWTKSGLVLMLMTF